MPELTPLTTKANDLGISLLAIPVKQPYSKEVRALAASLNLTEHLDAAFRIALSAFPPGSEATVQVGYSPDLDGEQLIVNVAVQCGVKEAVECYQQLLDRWTRELPIHFRDNVAVTFCPK